ncbi:unnamed protein product [Lactuca saligna]|uniref:Uncharacterized protein n=1 Tax=Lactuca saligna TaxID=75948 RepID=A0AA35VHD5_LACSI|nr:unnamed protein product [Lactuca saligna]
MAAKQAFRYMSRRLSSSGKILSEEEKAAENVYIKKTEKEKLEKLARKAQADATSATSGGGGGEAKGSGPAIGVSEDKNRNYAVIAGVVTAVGALGWYLKSKNKKSEDLHD